MRELIRKFQQYKFQRKNYRIKPTFRFHADTEDYYMSFLPTVIWGPWFVRYPNMDGVIDIWWLWFHILIGKWEVKK